MFIIKKESLPGVCRVSFYYDTLLLLFCIDWKNVIDTHALKTGPTVSTLKSEVLGMVEWRGLLCPDHLQTQGIYSLPIIHSKALVPVMKETRHYYPVIHTSNDT